MIKILQWKFRFVNMSTVSISYFIKLKQSRIWQICETFTCRLKSFMKQNIVKLPCKSRKLSWRFRKFVNFYEVQYCLRINLSDNLSSLVICKNCSFFETGPRSHTKQNMYLYESAKGLWQWCLICNINLLDWVHCLKCFSHNVSGGESTPVFRWGFLVRTTIIYLF